MKSATAEKWTWKDIENEIGLTRSWAEKMEAKGLLSIRSPKGTGRVARLFDSWEVMNMLRLSTFRVVGFTPEHLKSYRKLVMDFHKIIRKYHKGMKNRWEHAPVLLFHIEDFFPEGVDALDWDRVSHEDKILIKGYLDEALFHVIAAKKMIKEYRRKTELILGSLHKLEEGLAKDFIEPVKDIFFNKLQYGGSDSKIWRDVLEKIEG